MIDYAAYSAEALALDESFRAWVLENAESLFWERWLAEHPEKDAAVQQAKWVVRALYHAQEEISEAEVDEAIEQLVQRADERAAVVPLWRQTWVRVAAAVVLVPLAGWLIFQNNFKKEVTPY